MGRSVVLPFAWLGLNPVWQELCLGYTWAICSRYTAVRFGFDVIPLFLLDIRGV